MANIVQSAIQYSQAKAAGDINKLGAVDKVLNPALEALNSELDRREQATSDFINNLPDQYDLDLVPDQSKASLSSFLKQQKSDYAKLAQEASRYTNTNNPKYIEAVEGMEKIKSGMQRVYEDMQAVKLIRTYEIDNYKDVTALTQAERSQRDDLVNGTFDFNYTLDGAFYNNPNDKDDPIRGINLKKSGLLDRTVGDNVIKLQNRAYKLGKSNSDRKLVEMEARNYYQGMFGNTNTARQIAFKGMPFDNDNSMGTRYIDHYIAEQALLGAKGFEDIKVVDKNKDGMFNEGDYFEDQTKLNAKILDLKNDKKLDLSSAMTSFFTQMTMSEFDSGLAQYTPPGGEEGEKSFVPKSNEFVNLIKAEVPASLGLVTKNVAKQYQQIISDGKGGFNIVNQNGAILAGLGKLTLEQVLMYADLDPKDFNLKQKDLQSKVKPFSNPLVGDFKTNQSTATNDPFNPNN